MANILRTLISWHEDPLTLRCRQGEQGTCWRAYLPGPGCCTCGLPDPLRRVQEALRSIFKQTQQQKEIRAHHRGHITGAPGGSGLRPQRPEKPLCCRTFLRLTDPAHRGVNINRAPACSKRAGDGAPRGPLPHPGRRSLSPGGLDPGKVPTPCPPSHPDGPSAKGHAVHVAGLRENHGKTM